ncbi:MAG: thioesterase family protein [Candidatus Sedimenticola sp. 20ELBAFRAG]
MFEQKLKIEMGQVDGAGVIYAPRLMEISHSVYETFLAQHGWSARRILDEEWALPIVHMESDFHLPIELGDEIMVSLSLERLGESSFTLGYRFMKQGELAASAKSVHVAVEAGGKRSLPWALANLLTQA